MSVLQLVFLSTHALEHFIESGGWLPANDAFIEDVDLGPLSNLDSQSQLDSFLLGRLEQPERYRSWVRRVPPRTSGELGSIYVQCRQSQNIRKLCFENLESFAENQKLRFLLVEVPSWK
jgi:hypothetical protein